MASIWGGWWEGSPRERGYMYTYDRLMLLYRNQQNIAKQLSSI